MICRGLQLNWSTVSLWKRRDVEDESRDPQILLIPVDQQNRALEGLGTGQFFDTIFVSIQIDQYSIYHLIHALKTFISEIFVKSLQ